MGLLKSRILKLFNPHLLEHAVFHEMGWIILRTLGQWGSVLRVKIGGGGASNYPRQNVVKSRGIGIIGKCCPDTCWLMAPNLCFCSKTWSCFTEVPFLGFFFRAYPHQKTQKRQLCQSRQESNQRVLAGSFFSSKRTLTHPWSIP